MSDVAIDALILNGPGGARVTGASRSDPAVWIREHLPVLAEALNVYGFLLFQDLALSGADEFRTAMAGLVGMPFQYLDASTPRRTITDGVYTSTEYPSELKIPLHSELSFSAKFPRYICFYCVRPAPAGGETLLAWTAALHAVIEPEIRSRFENRMLRYIRNYYDWATPTWQRAFATDRIAEVSEVCRESGIDHRWQDGVLHTEQTRPASIVGSEAGEKLWFNQAHLFHICQLDADTRGAIEEMFTPDLYPRHVVFGDNTPIAEDDIRAVTAAMEREEMSIPLRKGEVVIVDNLRFAHGRAPYSGDRCILVLLASPHRSAP